MIFKFESSRQGLERVGWLVMASTVPYRPRCEQEIQREQVLASLGERAGIRSVVNRKVQDRGWGSTACRLDFLMTQPKKARR